MGWPEARNPTMWRVQVYGRWMNGDLIEIWIGQLNLFPHERSLRDRYKPENEKASVVKNEANARLREMARM
jgi:hypothetical protein